jgi:hypothetical protein
MRGNGVSHFPHVDMSRKPIDKYAISFATKNISEADNTKYSLAMVLMVLVAASYGCQSINSKAISPNADTVFYRISASIGGLESQFWKQSLHFLRDKKKKLGKAKCYIIVDETYESYTGKLLRKEKKFRETLTGEEKDQLRYIHKYKPKKGDTGSYKYLVFAVLYGKRRRVIRIKSLKRNEDYSGFIVKTLHDLRKELVYECTLFDRGFYSGSLISELKRNEIPFIVRARISKSMKKIFGFYLKWKSYEDFEIGESKTKANLVLGIDFAEGKRAKWAFITNLEFKNWREVRELYRKRWNIENIFKATDGIHLKAQTSNPATRLFCVCISFLFYNAWQNKKKRGTLLNFVMNALESIFDLIVKTVQFYRDRLKLNIPFWEKIICST